MSRRFISALLLFLAIVACEESPTEPPRALPSNTWWSDGEYLLQVFDGTVRVQGPNCYRGVFPAPALGGWRIFSQKGRYYRLHPQGETSWQAIFKGRAEETVITLSIELDDGRRFGPLRLQRQRPLAPPLCPP